MSPPANRVPVASYRLQLTPAFGFAAAIDVFDHLVALGITHVYLSPIAEAVPGSTHGYDVVDHTRARAELGGEPALEALFDAAAAWGLLVLFDHVPNHTATTRPELNSPWWALLRDGPTSPAAAWFDVDLSAGEGKVILPVLGSPLADALAAHAVSVVGDELVLYGERRLPLAAGTRDLPLDELVEMQHYVLTHWRSPVRNVRRFFTIDDLVAVRVEDPSVADVVDTLPARWASHPAFGGVRVDHVDGLADPLAYLRGLRARIGDEPLLLVEKILAPGESLPPAWPVDGTTGYEFIRTVDHVLLDPTAAAPLDASWQAVSGVMRSYGEIEEASRREVLAAGLRPDLLRTAATAASVLDGVDPELVCAAVEDLTVALPRYRTYLPDDDAGRAVLLATADEVRSATSDATALDRLVEVLLDPADAAEELVRTRWQQLTGPAMAKGAEDRAFYRYARLAALAEVGGDPSELATAPDDVHADQIHAQQALATPMLAGSTHDTKRSDDVRARSAALTWSAGEWARDVAAWAPMVRSRIAAVDGATLALALQTVVTCPGVDVDRLHGYLVKAAREADERTSWSDPDERYEHALGELAGELLGDGEVGSGLAAWSARLGEPGLRASVVATVLRCTCPGFPDVFQGTEVPTYRLVDPDNRDPPHWHALRAAVGRARVAELSSAPFVEDPGIEKTVVLVRLLALRHRRPDVFGSAGAYEPLHASSSLLAFRRGGDVVTIVAVSIALDPQATVRLPAGIWRDVLRDDAAAVGSPDAEIDASAAELLHGLPVAVLERNP